MITIGKRIRSLREEYGYTQRFLASKLGLTPKMISFYENEERFPPIDILLKLVNVFKVSSDYLLGISDVRDIASSDSHSYIYCNEITERIHMLSKTTDKNIEDLRPLLETDILNGYCKNPDFFLKDVYSIADFFGVSDEYILGGIEYEERTYCLNEQEKKLISSFRILNEDNKDIVIGETKKALREQKNETLSSPVLMAAHNDNATDPEEQEKIYRDLAKLKRPNS